MTWNFADIWEGIASTAGDEPALLHDDRCVSWTDFDRRSNALARYLIESGAGPGDKVAVYSYNRPEWLEGLAGIFKARCVPVNVNYRYRDEELAYILENSDAVAILFEAGFARSVDALRGRLPLLATLIELADGEPSSSWATAYETVVSGCCEPLGLQRSADDLLFMYTGGTTGVPKGVMWRQEDLWQTLGGGGDLVSGSNRPRDIAEHLDRLRAAGTGPRLLPACPLMHGTGQFTAIHALAMGGSIVTLPSHRFDAHELWEQVESKSVNIITIAGNITEGLTRVDAKHAAVYGENYERFRRHMLIGI
ncbi:MAG: AMP-binding protein, partial [Candidatus Binatia bacterium]